MSFTPVPAAASKVRASVLSALITEARGTFARMGSDQALTASSTTLQNVTQLAASVAANTTYFFEVVFSTSLAAGVAEDVKVGFTFPTGATLNVSMNGGTAAGVAAGASTDMNVSGTQSVTSGTTTFPFGVSTTGTVVMLWGILIVSSTAGTLQVQAAQNTAGVNVVTVRAGSLLFLKQME